MTCPFPSYDLSFVRLSPRPAGADSYYDYGPEDSVCQKGLPVIHLQSGDNRVCQGDVDCPMGYQCVGRDSGQPTQNNGVCCLAQKEMESESASATQR